MIEIAGIGAAILMLVVLVIKAMAPTDLEKRQAQEARDWRTLRRIEKASRQKSQEEPRE